MSQRPGRNAPAGSSTPDGIGAPAADVATRFEKIVSSRISVEIATRLTTAILSGQLRPGDRLPPERELTQRFQVSRMSVRDALRVLEARGLIEIRLGPRGGPFVRAPGSGLVGEGIASMMLVSPALGPDVTEARRILELGLVPLVVERATEADIAALSEICGEATDQVAAGSYSIELSTTFHVAFARASHNPALELLIASLSEAIRLSLERARAASPRSTGAIGVREHAALVRAIERRDGPGALAIMDRHLGRTARRLRASERP